MYTRYSTQKAGVSTAMLHRSRIVFTTIALLVIAGVSLFMGASALWRFWGSPLYMGALLVMLANSLMHVCALEMLLFSLRALWRNSALTVDTYHVLLVSAFSLLALSAMYTWGGIPQMSAAAGTLEGRIALICMTLLPLPQIIIVQVWKKAKPALVGGLYALWGVAALLAIGYVVGLVPLFASTMAMCIAGIAALVTQLTLYFINYKTAPFQIWDARTLGLMLLLLGGSTAAIFGALSKPANSVRIFHYTLLLYTLCVFWSSVRRNSVLRTEVNALRTLSLREEEYRIAAQHSGKLIARYDIATHTALFQPEAAQLFGVQETVENMPDAALKSGRIEAGSENAYLTFFEQILSNEPSGHGIFAVVDKQDAPMWIRADYTTIFDDEQMPVQAIISCYELKGMREKEAAYEKWRRACRSLDAEKVACFEINLTQGTLLDVWGELFSPMINGQSLQDTMNTVANDYLCPEDQEAFLKLVDRDRLLQCYAQDIRRETIECRRPHNDTIGWLRATLQMISDPYSTDVRAFLSIEDIDVEKSREAYEKKRSQTDELTGLLTRSSFIEQFSDICAEGDPGVCHAIIMIDLDGFKAVNDTYGHQFGDRVLADAAGDLRAAMRGNDLIGRFGGDEYMICLKNIPPDGAFLEHRCRTICRVLSKQFGDEVAVTASLGVACYPEDGRTFDELYQCADHALYSAKQQGRNCFVFYDRTHVQKSEQSAAHVEPSPVLPPTKEKPEPRHTLLVVDDQRINRAILHEIFKADYNVLEAGNGVEALEILRNSTNTISAMLLDLLMPEMSGLDVLKAMNEDAYYQSIPVVVVSAAAEDEYSAKAIELGAVDFVTKPIDEQLVKLRVRNAIFRREMENLRVQNRELLVQRASEARHQNQLRYLAEHDSLTHICNKTAFFRKTRTMLDEQPDRLFCIVSFDIQRFRAVNDIFGHEEGDRLLRFIAMQLRNDIGHSGICSRVNTDHFAFCIPYDSADLSRRIERLCDSLKSYDLSFEVMLSFGVYLIEDRSMSISQMHDRADMAKRTIKGSYIRHVAFYDETMREALLREQEIVNHMNAALEDGEFVVYYQPKCRLDTGALVGAEALVRWNHPVHGFMSPGDFVPVFEKNGFIMKLDVYVWEQVCAYLSHRLHINPNDTLHISVNISRANLYNPALCSTLDDLCRRYGVPNSHMPVEITESAYVENAHLLLGLTDELHRYGFTVEMDDFGSGYSSLNMLKEIPVDTLKLDMRLLEGVDGEGRGGGILKSVVSMANQLDLEVIAEGVETEEQARFLAAIGCRLAQGYYYARPMDEAAFNSMVEARISQTVPTTSLEAAQQELNHLLCSAALCRNGKDGLQLVSVNDYYLHMMGAQREIFDEVDKRLALWTGVNDLENLQEAMKTAKAENRECPCVYLQRDLHEHYHLLHSTIRYLLSTQEGDLYLFSFTDVSEKNGRAVL